MIPPPPTAHKTVEEVVRHELSKALGGKRGMLEAAVPTALFTVLFLTTHELKLAVVISGAITLVLLAVRLAQKSSPQFVLNALFGIGIGAFFAYRAAKGGGDEGDQALAYFLPGVLYNAVYSVVMIFTIVIRWPIVGFFIGSVSGDPTAWHQDKNIIKLCSRLTWILVLPCVVRLVVQGPMYLAGRNEWWDTDAAVAALGVSKLVMGWPLQIAALATMVWLLSRNATPLQPGEPEPHLTHE